jgi:hypothetical protein
LEKPQLIVNATIATKDPTYKAQPRAAGTDRLQPLVISKSFRGFLIGCAIVKLVFERKGGLGKKTAQFLLVFDF